MSHDRTRWSLAGLLVGLLLSLPSSAAFGAPPAQGGENLLHGADFEDSFSGEDGDTMRVGEGWEGWYLDAEDTCHDHVPTFEASRDVEERNHAGRKSTQIGLRDATYTAGIFQVVDGVEEGQAYKFSIWGHVLYATSPTDTLSNGPDPRMKVGIDPSGGINPFADTVRWSQVNWEFDEYFEFSVVATAQGSTLTVFTYSTQPECLSSNFTFWDDASLVATTEAETPAEIPNNPEDLFRDVASDAIVKTSSTEFEVGATVAGTASGAASDDEAAAESGGTASVCLLMFEDANSNGSREVQEMKLSGGVFSLTADNQVAGTYTTDGASEPYCFSGLSPGSYTLTWQAQGYDATSTQGWALTLEAGETLSREFGALVGGEAAQDGGGGGAGRVLRSLAIAVGAVIFLLVVGGGVVLVMSRIASRRPSEEDDSADDTFVHLE